MAAARVRVRVEITAAEQPVAAALGIALAKRDVASIVALQRAHTQSVGIQLAACYALCELLDDSEESRAAVVAAGALKPLLTALRAYPDVVEMLDMGMHALIKLLSHSIAYSSPLPDDLVTAAAALGAVQIAVDALHAHTNHEGVVQSATGALFLLIRTDSEQGVAAVAAGAAEALVRAQHAHVTDAQVQANSFLSLLALLHHSSAAAVEHICAAGAVAAGLAALRQHSLDVKVQEVGWNLLAQLCTQDDAWGTAGTFELVVAALRVHATHTGVQAGAC
jgi:hypothetical protein